MEDATCLHSKVVDLMEALYTDTCSCVCADGVLSDWFTVGSCVRQGCRIAPDLFLEPMDHVMERTAHRGMAGVTRLLQPPTYVTPVDTSAGLGSDSTAIIDVVVEIRRVDDSVN